MEKTNYPDHSICILKRGILNLRIKHTDYNPKGIYRVSFDENQKGCLVYGEWMTITDFEAQFELYVPFLHGKLKELDMLKDGKPVTFKKFKETVSINDYGRGARKLKIMFLGVPKDNLFAFYPAQNPNTIALKECYENYVKLVNGDWSVLDEGDVIWGNSGYPLTYGEIYYR